jgi:hypothetical protein
VDDTLNNSYLDTEGAIAIAENLAVTIGVTGAGLETYWVLCLDRPDDAIHGCYCSACAPHDQLRA